MAPATELGTSFAERVQPRWSIGRTVGAVGVLTAPLWPFSPLFGGHGTSHGLLSRDKTDSQPHPPAHPTPMNHLGSTFEPPGADLHAGWCGRGARCWRRPVPIYSGEVSALRVQNDRCFLGSRLARATVSRAQSFRLAQPYLWLWWSPSSWLWVCLRLRQRPNICHR